MSLVYENTRQLPAARLVMSLALVCVAACVVLAADLYQARSGLPMLLMLGLGALIVLGLEAYSRTYVVRIRLTPPWVEVETVRLLGVRRQRLRLVDFAGATEIGGDLTLGSYTPAFTRVRVAGRRLPLLLDSRAERVQGATLRALAQGRLLG
ncbi:MAG: hypothetical protein RIC56_19905 [Pseudomonadales bacterium]